MTATANRKHGALLTPGVLRRMAGWSQARVAVFAGTGVGLVRIYEIDPLAVTDLQKRRALARLYEELREDVLQLPSP